MVSSIHLHSFFIQLMIHVKIDLFNTFTLIFYSTYGACENWSVQYIYTPFLFNLWYMQKLVCLILLHSFFIFHSYASLNTTTKLINCNNNFNSHCKSLSVSLLFSNIFKKDIKKLLPFLPQLDNCIFHGNIVLHPPLLPSKKFLVWHWCYLGQCNVTHKNQLLFFASGKFSKMGAGSQRGQFSFVYDHKIMIKIGAYFKQKVLSNNLLLTNRSVPLNPWKY